MFRRFAGLGFALVLLSTSMPLSAAAPSSSLSSLERDELTYSYRQLVNQFYKRVDTQHVLDGARTRIVTLLERDGIKNPSIVSPHASSDLNVNERELTRTANAAVSRYGTKASSRMVTYAAIAGMLAAVGDRYTTFLSPKQYAELNEGLDGQTFGGVGLSIGIDE